MTTPHSSLPIPLIASPRLAWLLVLSQCLTRADISTTTLPTATRLRSARSSNLSKPSSRTFRPPTEPSTCLLSPGSSFPVLLYPADCPPSACSRIEALIPTGSTFAESNYTGRITQAAMWLIFIGSCSALLAFILGVIPHRLSFLGEPLRREERARLRRLISSLSNSRFVLGRRLRHRASCRSCHLDCGLREVSPVLDCIASSSND